MTYPLDRLNVSDLLTPAADAAGRTSAVYKSMKNAHKGSLIFKVTQGNSATVLVTPLQATHVAGTGSKPLTANVPIYTKLDIATSDVWVRQADGKNYTTDAAVKTKYVRFDIDPDALDIANNFDCVGVSTGASHASNITSADMILGPSRYVEDVSIAATAD